MPVRTASISPLLVASRSPRNRFSIEIRPEGIAPLHHASGRGPGAEVPRELFGREGRGTAEVGLVADAADVEDRARPIRLGQLKGVFGGRRVELGPVELLALEDATA